MQTQAGSPHRRGDGTSCPGPELPPDSIRAVPGEPSSLLPGDSAPAGGADVGDERPRAFPAGPAVAPPRPRYRSERPGALPKRGNRSAKRADCPAGTSQPATPPGVASKPHPGIERGLAKELTAPLLHRPKPLQPSPSPRGEHLVSAALLTSQSSRHFEDRAIARVVSVRRVWRNKETFPIEPVLRPRSVATASSAIEPRVR
jgi:hypothetical protein